jgi:hypothetical protein
MSLTYVPWLLLWAPFFAGRSALTAVPYDPSSPTNPALYANLPYLLCSLSNPLVTALTAMLVLRVARRVGLGRGWAVAAALAYGLASPAAAYARYDFAQPVATLALTAALWGLLRWEGGLAGLGAPALAIAYGVLCRLEFLALAPWAAGWVLVREGRRHPVRAGVGALAVALPSAAAFLLGVWVHRFKQGAPTALPPWSQMAAQLLPDAPADVLTAVAGQLVSPGRGILVFFPLAWLAIPGLRRLAAVRPDAGWLFGSLLALLLAVYCAFRVWWAGVSWGPRLLVPLVPLLAVAAAVWAQHAAPGRRWPRLAFAALALAGVVVSWNGMLVDVNRYSGWVVHALGVWPDTGRIQFSVVSSPLVSGWPFRTHLPLDLFWVRLSDGSGLPELAELPAGAQAWVRAHGATAARLLPAVLLGGLAWSARRVRGMLRASG